MRNQSKKSNKKTSNNEAYRLRQDAFDDIISISDDFSVLSSRAQEFDEEGNVLGKEYPVVVDKHTAAIDALRMILNEKNDITGIVMFTASKGKSRKKQGSSLTSA